MITSITVSEPEDRRAAAIALGGMGPEAKAAVPALITAVMRKNYGNDILMETNYQMP